MAQEGTFGVLMVGGGLVLGFVVFRDLLSGGQGFNLGSIPGGQWVTPQSDTTGGVTSSGAGYYTTQPQGSSLGQQQANCRQSGGIWYNGQCRHFTGAGANK